MRRRLMVLVLALGALAAGCADDDAPEPAASVIASPTPVAAEQQLADLAAAGRTASYVARYRVTGKPPGVAAIYRTPIAYRFDLTVGTSRASLIGTSTGTVSCSLGRRSLCLQVAGPHQPLPRRFDAGLHRVFTDYLTVLAVAPERQRVEEAGTLPATEAVPAATCFTVTPRSTVVPTTAPKVIVATGTYCLSDTGLPVKVSYPSGDLVLQSITGTPDLASFTPPSKPVPLPR